MRLFQLNRRRDPSGISGVGVVAQGVEFDDGSVVIRWLPKPGLSPTTVVHYDIASVHALHGHDGGTRVEWVTS